jgi:phytanoyl-CoA hydroxylase
MWIPLDDATIRNGCLWVIPGTHNEPVRHRFKAKEDKSGCFYEPAIDEEKFKEIWPKDKFLPLEVKAGSLVILHGSVAHMSEDNTSPNGRNVYTFHIVDGEAQWAPENWLQYPNGSPFEDL